MLAVGTAVAVLAVSGVAWAYWTTAARGTGSAQVVADAPRLTLHASTTGQLLPGTSVPVSITADNVSSTALQVGRVELVGITADPDHTGCAVADFSMTDIVLDRTVPPHTKAFPLTSAALSYADTAVDQSACQGATLTLSISSD